MRLTRSGRDSMPQAITTLRPAAVGCSRVLGTELLWFVDEEKTNSREAKRKRRAAPERGQLRMVMASTRLPTPVPMHQSTVQQRREHQACPGGQRRLEHPMWPQPRQHSAHTTPEARDAQGHNDRVRPSSPGQWLATAAPVRDLNEHIEHAREQGLDKNLDGMPLPNLLLADASSVPNGMPLTCGTREASIHPSAKGARTRALVPSGAAAG